MLVSMNWIKEYVDLENENLPELIQRFTLSTAEVEDIIYKGTEIDGVVVAQILSVENHPDSKKLHLLKIDAGDRIYDCVCGAPNVREGMRVAFAKTGGKVPGMEMKTCKVAGYTSEGMCCSESELGISEDHSGILEIDKDAPLGTSIKDIYPIDDVIFEVDNKSLTNRPDLWGHYGIAREFAALTKQEIKPLELGELKYDGDDMVEVELKSEHVYRYTCVKMDNITKNRSPIDMKIRLTYCGMRPINLLADLTNYIMMELGQPTHAFNAKKIDKIVVAEPDKTVKFTTLDSNERDISTETLLIYNNDEPIGIAGIMGGLDSEIVDDTDSVVLECANFDGVSIRKSSSALGLRTDASMRYEKILDPELTMLAAKRFEKLLCGIDSGARVVSKVNDKVNYTYPEITLTFDKAYVDRYTGIDISTERICETLRLLGFKLNGNDGNFTVTVPSWRATKDVTIKADIIEEITRIYGYDNFEIKTTKSALAPVRMERGKTEEAQIKDILVRNFALHEVHSYIWCDGKKYKKLGIDVEEGVRILNIATPENGTMRNSMLPTLISLVYENRSYADEFGIFEIGRVADGIKADGTANECKRLGIALFDKKGSEKQLYFKAVEIIRCITSQIKHLSVQFKKSETAHKWQHPKNTSKITLGSDIGVICTLHPSVLSKIDKNCSVVCVEIDLDDMAKIVPVGYNYDEPSKFPSVEYDLSLVCGDKRYDELKTAWESLGVEELKSVSVIDLYDDGTVKSITLRFNFSSAERSLTMEEIQGTMDKVLCGLNAMGVERKG